MPASLETQTERERGSGLLMKYAVRKVGDSEMSWRKRLAAVFGKAREREGHKLIMSSFSVKLRREEVSRKE